MQVLWSEDVAFFRTKNFENRTKRDEVTVIFPQDKFFAISVRFFVDIVAHLRSGYDIHFSGTFSDHS